MAGESGMANGGASYSPGMGLIYVFNLIVGTGALTLPAAFAHAGWLVSLCIILILAFVSYLTMTFVVESMAAANAILRSRRAKQLRKKREEDHHANIDDDSDAASSPTKSLLAGIKERKKSPTHSPHRYYQSVSRRDDDELDEGGTDRSPLLNASTNGVTVMIGPTVATTEMTDLDDDDDEENCDIRETVEMGKLAGLFFNQFGTVLFFICIAVYLYGDLAIYGAAVGKSLRDTACTYFPPDVPCNETLNGTVPCWGAGSDMSRDDAYRLFLSAFVIIIGAFGFFNVQKTMLLQIVTSIVRWTAFISMIVLACIRLATSQSEDLGHPPAVRIEGTPTLFGACVYSFMCHHSLPSLLTPIRPKRGLYRLLAADYILIAGFYLLLGLTGAFAFPHVADLYTLNFVPDRCSPAHSPNSSATALTTHQSVIFLSGLPENAVRIIQQILFYFLSLFPVFTLSTSFPIITITLRNNLKQLCLRRPESEYGFIVRRLLFPLLALVPPAVVAVVTSDVGFLVGFTGSYAGAAVQYVVPALLALRARTELAKEFSPALTDEGETTPSGPNIRNAFASPFRHQAYIWITLIWATACVVFVTYNHVMSH